MKRLLRAKEIKGIVILFALFSINLTCSTAKADQVHGILAELRVVPNQCYVKFNDNYDRCGANGKFFIRYSSDIAPLADAVMKGRQVQFEFHCGNGFHIVDSWKLRQD